MPYQSEHWTPVKDPTVPCRKCKEPGNVFYRVHESDCGGYEDIHYFCFTCKKDWWIDGPDA